MRFSYYIFHEGDLEEVLGSLEDAKVVYKRFRFVEVMAEFDGGVVGKYRDKLFAISPKPVKFDVEPLGEMDVEVVRVENSEKLKDLKDFKPFKFGRYTVGEFLILEVVDDLSTLIFDYLPPLIAEIVAAKVLLKDCHTKVSQIVKEEARIVREIVELSEKVASADMEVLQKLSFEISAMRTSFFTKFMRFKSELEEVFSSIARAKKISSNLEGLLSELIDELSLDLQTLTYYESRFEQTLLGVRDVLDVVHLRMEMFSNLENLELQRRTSSLQAATAIIEFVAVYYYTLKIWESFLPIKSMPPQISFSLLVIFTTLVVIYTDALGEYIRTRKVSNKLAVLTILLLATLSMMVFLPIFLATSQL